MTRRRRAELYHTLTASLLVPAAVFAAVWWANVSGRLFRLQAMAYDVLIRWTIPASTPASPVVIVGIDDADIRCLGQYPIGDRQVVELLERLETAGARAIGIDFYRDMPALTRDKTSDTEADYQAFVDYVKAHPNVVCVERLPAAAGDQDYVNPPVGLNSMDESQQVAASAFAFDSDGAVRRAIPFWPDPRTGDTVPALGPLLALKYLDAEGVSLKSLNEDDSRLALGRAVLTRPKYPSGFYARSNVTGEEAAGENLQWMVDFRGPALPRVDTVRGVMAATPQDYKDKLVIIGVAAKGVKDVVDSPLAPLTDGTTFGFVMHGYIADQMIRWAHTGQGPARFTSRTVDAGWTAGWAVLGGIVGGLGATRSLLKMLLVCVAGVTILVAGATWALRAGLILPLVPPLLAAAGSVLLAVAYMAAVDRGDRQFVQRMMAMHISRPIAEQLLESRNALSADGKLAPQRTVASVLYSDLVGFTPIAEHMDAADLMAWLNDFFEQMTRVVEECGGMVNKFNGDMVMALFGPPRTRTNEAEIAADARNAVRCAVRMRRALADMNRHWHEQGLPTPRMRIGIHTGPLVAGSLGGRDRIEYTVIGDTVNTASRLESSNKECMDDARDGTRIIIGDATCRAITGHYLTRPLGPWQVKGRASVDVHAVLDEVVAPGTRIGGLA